MNGTSRSPVYDAFGAYVRSQRQLAQLSLRQAAEMARISNPYLSQIEHGLALPSINVIRALADALSVSAETLLLYAAGVDSPRGTGRPSHTEEAIRHDPRLDDGQKHALLAVLSSFVGTSPDTPDADATSPDATTPDATTPDATKPAGAPRKPRPAAGRTTSRRSTTRQGPSHG